VIGAPLDDPGPSTLYGACDVCHHQEAVHLLIMGGEDVAACDECAEEHARRFPDPEDIDRDDVEPEAVEPEPLDDEEVAA